MKISFVRNFAKGFLKILIDNEIKEKLYEFYYDKRKISNFQIYLKFSEQISNT